MKVSLEDLDKAIAKMKAETRDLHVHIKEDCEKLVISAIDKEGKEVEITVFSERANTLPKIKHTETLK